MLLFLVLLGLMNYVSPYPFSRSFFLRFPGRQDQHSVGVAVNALAQICDAWEAPHDYRVWKRI